MIELYNCPVCNSKVILVEHHETRRGVRECVSVICRGCFSTYDSNDNKIDVSKPDCFKLPNIEIIHSFEKDSEYLSKLSEIATELKKQWNFEVELFIDNKIEEYRKSIDELSSVVPIAKSTKKSGRL